MNIKMENKKIFLTNRKIKEKVNKNKYIQNIKDKEPLIYKKESKNKDYLNTNNNAYFNNDNKNNNISFQNDNLFDNSKNVNQIQNNQTIFINSLDDVELFDEPKKSYNKLISKTQSAFFTKKNNYGNKNINKIFNHNENLFDNEQYIVEKIDNNNIDKNNISMFEKDINYKSNKFDFNNLHPNNSFCVSINNNYNYNLSLNNFSNKEANDNDDWKKKLCYINEQKKRMQTINLTEYFLTNNKEYNNVDDNNKIYNKENEYNEYNEKEEDNRNKMIRTKRIKSSNFLYNNNNNNKNDSSILTFLKPFQNIDKTFTLNKMSEKKNDINNNFNNNINNNMNNHYINKENEIKGRINKYNNNDDNLIEDKFTFKIKQNNNNIVVDNNEVCELDVPASNINLYGNSEQKTAQFPDVINKDNCYKYIPKTLTSYDFFYTKKKKNNNKENKVYTKGRYDYMLLEQSKKNNLYSNELNNTQNNFNKNNNETYIIKKDELNCNSENNDIYMNKSIDKKLMTYSKKNNNKIIGSPCPIKPKNLFNPTKKLKKNDLYKKANIQDIKLSLNEEKMNKDIRMRNVSFDDTPLFRKGQLNTDFNDNQNKTRFSIKNNKNENQKTIQPYFKPNHSRTNTNSILIPKNKYYYQAYNNNKSKENNKINNNNNNTKSSSINNSFSECINNKIFHYNSFIIYKKKPQKNNNIKNNEKFINKKEIKNKIINKQYKTNNNLNKNLNINNIMSNKNKENYEEKNRKLLERIKQNKTTKNDNNNYLKEFNYKSEELITTPQKRNNIKYSKINYIIDSERNIKIRKKINHQKICRMNKLINYFIKLPKINNINNKISKQNIKIYKLDVNKVCYITKSKINIYKNKKIDICYYSKTLIAPPVILQLPKNNICYYYKIRNIQPHNKNINNFEDIKNQIIEDNNINNEKIIIKSNSLDKILINKANLISQKLIGNIFTKKNENDIKEVFTQNNLISNVDDVTSVQESNKDNEIFNNELYECKDYRSEKKKNMNNYNLMKLDYLNKIIKSEKVINKSRNIYLNMINKEKNENNNIMENIANNNNLVDDNEDIENDNNIVLNENNECNDAVLEQELINSKCEENQEEKSIKNLKKKRRRLGTKIDEDNDNNSIKEENQNFSFNLNYKNSNIIMIIKEDLENYINYLLSSEINSKTDIVNYNNKYNWSKTVSLIGNNNLDNAIKAFIKICIDNCNDDNSYDINFIYNEYIKNLIEHYMKNINEYEFEKFHNEIKKILKEIIYDINFIMFEIIGNLLFIFIENKLYFLEDLNDLINNDKDLQTTVAIIIKYAILSSGDKIKQYYNDFQKILFYDNDIFNDYVINNIEIISKIK